VRRLLERLVLAPWRAIDAERVRDHGGAVDWRPLFVLVTVAVSLTVQNYWGERPVFVRLFPRHEAAWAGDYYDLMEFAWWTGWRIAGYVLMPIVVIWAMPGERVRDYFVGIGHLKRHLHVYLVLLALVAPMVYAASQRGSFQATYPFYKWANRSRFDLLAWEAMYVAQFAALEFFFRGFMLKGLVRSFGSSAVFVMIVPYCMIHYGKPMPETLGAIGAGLILGTMALRSRSIWGGVLVHAAVAVSMDVLALSHCPPAHMGLPCLGH